jgi:TPR repeat protein
LYEGGLGVARNEATAAKYYQKGCEGRNLRGCHRLGALYEKGLGVAKDQSKALALYQDACSKGFADACTSAKAGSK